MLKRIVASVFVATAVVVPVTMTTVGAQPNIVNHGACTQLVRDLGLSPSILSPGQSGVGPLTVNPNGELVGTPKGFIGWMGCAR